MRATAHIAEYAGDLFPDSAPSLRPPAPELRVLESPLAQMAPGVWVAGVPAFELPSHVLCRLVPGALPGTWTLEPEAYPGYVRMTDNIGERLGVIGLSATTMRRLMWAGFVEFVRLAPGCIHISIESLLDHFSRTANNNEWWTPERLRVWRETIEPEEI